MPNFDPSTVTNLVGLWDFRSGATTADTGLDDGIAQNGEFAGNANASGDFAHFDGNGDDFDVDGGAGATTDAPFDMASGTIEVQFVQDAHVGTSPDTIVNRGEYADRSSEGYFNISVQANGAIRVIHCANGEDAVLTTSPGLVGPGQDVNVTYTWDEATGVSLVVENLDSGSSQTVTSGTTGLTMEIGDNDYENFTFGARESDDGVKDEFFDGSIDYVAIYEAAGPEADGAVDGESFGEEMGLGYDDGDGPIDQGGDQITNDGDLIFGNGGDDTIDGAGGNDTIYGDSVTDTVTTTAEIFRWSDAPGFGNLVDTTGFTQSTGTAEITFSVTSSTPNVVTEFETQAQNTDALDATVGETSSLQSIANGSGQSVAYDGTSNDGPLQNVEFRINDIDGDGTVRIEAFDADGNSVEVVLSNVGSGLAHSDTNTVAGNDTFTSTDANYTADTAAEHSVLVTIPGPVTSFAVIHSQFGTDNSGINITDITYDAVDVSAEDAGDDVIDGSDGDDLLFGQDGDDTISGGADNDVIYGDNGDNTGSGVGGITRAEIDPVAIDFGNSSGETAGENDASPGDSVVYSNVATLADGTVVAARLVLVSSSDPNLQIDLASSSDSEILLNANNDATVQGETATFRFEFFDQATGDPVELEPGIVFADLDQNTGQEVLRIDSDTLLNVGVPSDSSLDVNFSGGVLAANGTEDNADANDPDSQIATVFGTTSSVEFTLTARGVNSGTNFGTLDGQEFTYLAPFASDSSGNGNDVLIGDEGEDTIFGEGGADTITGGADADSLSGGDDADVFLGATDGDVVDGGAGGDDFDTLDLRGLGPIEIVDEVADANGNSTSGTINFLDTGGSMTFSEIEEILADPSAPGPVDGLDDGELMEPDYTDAQGDQIDGADGDDDTIFGNGGDDTIDSGAGDDTVDAGDGDDVIVLTDGVDADSLIGGEGDETDGDTLDASALDQDLALNLTAPETGTLTDRDTFDQTSFEEIENFVLGSGDDIATGSDEGDNIDGGAGDDLLAGNEGDDTLIGGAGEDTIFGGDNDDLLDGGTDDDVINGDAGEDTILGSAGDDTIDGGTVELVGEGTDEVTSVETYIAPESASEADEITLTTPVLLSEASTEISGLDDAAFGEFTALNGDVFRFGPPVSVTPGVPAADYLLSDILGGNSPDGVLPAVGPAGAFSIQGGDEGGQIGEISFDNFETINFTIVDDVSPGTDGPVDGTDDGELMEPLYTDAQGDQIDGADGDDDTIFGNGGNDTIDSGDGNDSVDGGDGDDTFVISQSGDGIDNDIIIGGEGDEIDGDTLDITDVEDDLLVDIFAPETGTVSDAATGDVTNFSEIENILLGAGDDTVIGSTGDDNVDSGGGDDSMSGGEGNDTLSSSDGLDTIDGGIGDDSLTGGDEADLIICGEGDDTLIGGRGPDTLDGGEGDDSVLGGADNDSIIGSDGSDVVEDLGGNNIIDTSGGSPLPDIGFPAYGPFPDVPADSDPDDDRDFVTTGDGNDSITTGDDADTIVSGGGNDTINSGIDDDEVDAGSGDDLVTIGEGNDTVLGGDGNDTIYGGLGPSFPTSTDIPDAPGTGPFGPEPVPGNGRDSIDGGRGNDLIYGEDDDDTLIGGLGADTLDGGIDDDLLQGGVGQDDMIGGQGADTMEGGDDRDFFIINEREDAFGDVVDGGTGGNDVDRLTLTGLGRFEIVGETTDADGDSTSGTVNFLDDLGNIEGSLTFTEIERLVICFTPGTAIATPRGEVDVANLQVGDRVITRDNGVQEISWIGRKKLGAADLIADPKLRPVLIKKGSLGNNLPERDMMVSPNHRMLMANSQTQVLFDEREVLVASKYLVGQPGIFQLDTLGVEYVHVMFENHEVILGDGTWTESFQPGDHSLSGIDEEQRDEIFKLFPSLQNEKGRRAYSSARQSLKAHEAKMLRETMGLV